jgi:hypothetical protein
MKTLSSKFGVWGAIGLALALSGCASAPVSGRLDSSYESSTYVRNTQGQTIARIQNGNIYNTSGVRIGSIKK